MIRDPLWRWQDGADGAEPAPDAAPARQPQRRGGPAPRSEGLAAHVESDGTLAGTTVTLADGTALRAFRGISWRLDPATGQVSCSVLLGPASLNYTGPITPGARPSPPER